MTMENTLTPELPAIPPLPPATGSEVHFWKVSEVRTLCGIWMPSEYPDVTMRHNDVTCHKCCEALGINPPNTKISDEP